MFNKSDKMGFNLRDILFSSEIEMPKSEKNFKSTTDGTASGAYN